MRRNALFTMVELLIVIAIIVLLAGLLLPSLIRSRGAAKATACKSLLKQYAIATESYANDYGDFYPDGRRYLDKSSLFLSYFSGAKTSGAQNIARCPGDASTESLDRLATINAEGYDNCVVSIGTCENTLSDSGRPTSMGPMAFWRKRGEVNKSKSIGAKFSPSKMFTWADYQNNPKSTLAAMSPKAAFVKPSNGGTSGTLGSLAFRHNDRSNAAYRDGHVGDWYIQGAKQPLINNGHDFGGDGIGWDAATASGQQYKMYYPFGPDAPVPAQEQWFPYLYGDFR